MSDTTRRCLIPSARVHCGIYRLILVCSCAPSLEPPEVRTVYSFSSSGPRIIYRHTSSPFQRPCPIYPLLLRICTRITSCFLAQVLTSYSARCGCQYPRRLDSSHVPNRPAVLLFTPHTRAVQSGSLPYIAGLPQAGQTGQDVEPNRIMSFCWVQVVACCIGRQFMRAASSVNHAEHSGYTSHQDLPVETLQGRPAEYKTRRWSRMVTGAGLDPPESQTGKAVRVHLPRRGMGHRNNPWCEIFCSSQL
jgi:hypothetical protein